MRKLIPWVIVVAAIALAASCKSAPTPSPEPPPAATPAPAPAATAPAATAPATTAPAQAAPLPEAELARARGLKQKADGYGLAQYAPSEYAAASTDLQSGEEKYGKDNAFSKNSLEKAIAGFEAVMAKGGGIVVARLQERCAASKQAADDLKASVAVKDEYARALETYTLALREREAGNLEQAGLAFDKAAGMFDAVAVTAGQKRERALEAIKGMVQGMVAADQKAQAAQQSLEKEGFSAEGEVR